MAYSFKDDGRLDLSSCFMTFCYDTFDVEKLAREYYFAELLDLVAWDGKPVRGMQHEDRYLHMVCRHARSKGDLNALMDLDVRRVEMLPIFKLAVTGKLDVDVYRQARGKKEDKVEVVVKGPHIDYVVALACVKDYYVVRSAYPADEIYVEKIKRTGELVESIRQNE